MENTNNTPNQPLWKQLLGALIGGTLALALYYGYEYVKPKVTAYLTLPPAERMYDLGSANIADKTTDESNRKRLLSRNVRVAQQMQEDVSLNSVDDHSLDIAWPGHDPDNPKYTEVTGIVPEVEVAEEQMPETVAMEVQMLDEQMGSHEMGMDSWDALWGDIRDREDTMEQSDAENLPDTGFGLGFIVAGSAGGALASRRRKRKMNA